MDIILYICMIYAISNYQFLPLNYKSTDLLIDVLDPQIGKMYLSLARSH